MTSRSVLRKRDAESSEFEGLRTRDYTSSVDGCASLAVVSVPSDGGHPPAWSERSDKYTLVVAGAVSFTIGSMMLIDSPDPYLRISLYAIIPAVISTAAFTLFAVGYALKAQKRRTTTGSQGLIGETGRAHTAVDSRSGKVFVHGEYWFATSETPVEPDTPVRVVEINGLRLKVESLDSDTDATQ